MPSAGQSSVKARITASPRSRDCTKSRPRSPWASAVAPCDRVLTTLRSLLGSWGSAPGDDIAGEYTPARFQIRALRSPLADAGNRRSGGTSAGEAGVGPRLARTGSGGGRDSLQGVGLGRGGAGDAEKHRHAGTEGSRPTIREEELCLRLEPGLSRRGPRRPSCLAAALMSASDGRSLGPASLSLE